MEKTQNNWLNKSKNPLARIFLVGIPTIAGAYLGWKHGSELASYATETASNSDVFYHQFAAGFPLISKVAGACVEGTVLNRLGRLVSGVVEGIASKLEYSTENTTMLDEQFASAQLIMPVSFEKDSYNNFVRSFINRFRETGKFRAVHIDSVRKKLRKGILEEMLEKEYLTSEIKLGAKVISPTYKAIRTVY